MPTKASGRLLLELRDEGVDPPETVQVTLDPARSANENAQAMFERARKIERFLSQPFYVAEVFTGSPGKYVPVKDTVRGFKMILDGKLDDVAEGDFYMKGGIDEVLAAAKKA